MITCFSEPTADSIPVIIVDAQAFQDLVACNDGGFKGVTEKAYFVPKPGGGIERIIFEAEESHDIWFYASLAEKLPTGTYHLDKNLDEDKANKACLGWACSFYAFDRYKTTPTPRSDAHLVWPDAVDKAWVERTAESIFLTRDLINTPTNDMGPKQLAEAAIALAKSHEGKVTIVEGENLLKQNYPMIHTVGRASPEAPRLIDLRWYPQQGKSKKKVTLVGKGVCFDTGGLDLKPSDSMLTMKKDMGGAAHVLGLAKMLMMAELPLELRVLIPAVENSVAGNAMRPLDVIKSRKGLTVEIGNTDAEGRLVLCDALTEACQDKPDLILDCATLTGAARVALGTEVPVFFSNNKEVTKGLSDLAFEEDDPLWELPLYQPYFSHLKSTVADLNNVGKSGYGGAITAALFLEKFVDPDIPWIHVDLMAWNLASKPGQPEGGEAMGLRVLFRFIADFIE